MHVAVLDAGPRPNDPTLEYADDMALMVDVCLHLRERLQKIADQSAELADLGLHFKKTGIIMAQFNFSQFTSINCGRVVTSM